MFNSVVSIDLNSGIYKWHFQEIEHDLWNLDLAAPPILLSINEKDYIAQATKTGQLLLLNRKDGKPSEEILKKNLILTTMMKKTFSVFNYFPEWLQYSRGMFLKNDINELSSKFQIESQDKINSSKIGDYIPLSKYEKYIYYGIHGGTQWPGIASTPDGIVVVPSNNIAYRVKLKNPKDFEFKKEFNLLFKNFVEIKVCKPP